MIGLDTNVLLRYVMGDDVEQRKQAKKLIDDSLSGGETLFVSLVTLVEAAWTMRNAYGMSRDAVCDVVAALASTPGVILHEREAVERAVGLSQTAGCDLPDALIAELGRQAGCSRTVTFDIAAAKKLAPMELIA